MISKAKNLKLFALQIFSNIFYSYFIRDVFNEHALLLCWNQELQDTHHRSKAFRASSSPCKGAFTILSLITSVFEISNDHMTNYGSYRSDERNSDGVLSSQKLLQNEGKIPSLAQAPRERSKQARLCDINLVYFFKFYITLCINYCFRDKFFCFIQYAFRILFRGHCSAIVCCPTRIAN